MWKWPLEREGIRKREFKRMNEEYKEEYEGNKYDDNDDEEILAAREAVE